MKVKCVAPSGGYEYDLTEGKEYDVVDICDGICGGDHYITVVGDQNRKLTALRYRFNITKEQAIQYVKEHDNQSG